MKVNIGRYPKNSTDRKVKVKIEKQDTWNLDETLAHIIHPALLQLKAAKRGVPYVELEDAPHVPRCKDVLSTKYEYNAEAWEYVLDEMIYAMQQIKDGRPDEYKFYNRHGDNLDREGLMTYSKRLQNGCRLFGVYFQNLWD